MFKRLNKGQNIPLGISWSTDDLGFYTYFRLPIWLTHGTTYDVDWDCSYKGFKVRHLLFKFSFGGNKYSDFIKVSFGIDIMSILVNIGKQVEVFDGQT